MENDNQEGLKFLSVKLENFKNFTKKEVEILGRSFEIVGPNGSGKSSLIQAIVSPLNSKILPSQVIKKGEERAKVEVVLGGIVAGKQVKYIMDLHFTKGNQKGRLVLYNEDGSVIPAPATFLKSLLGSFSFDITSWMNDTKDNKLKMLKKLTGCEADIDRCSTEIKEEMVRRKVNKEKAEEMEAILKNHGLTPDEIEKYSSPVDVDAIQTELMQASEKSMTYDRIVKGTREAKEAADSHMKRIEELQKEIDDLRKKAEDQYFAHEKGNSWLAKTKRPDVEEINARMTSAVKHNEKHNSVMKLAGQQKEMLKCKESINACDANIEKLQRKRADIIKSSQLPIEGLEFTEDEIFINGLPLEEGQQNTAALFDIGVDVSMALNPNLKVILLHDASLFDTKNLEMVLSKAEKKGYQVIAEKVSDNNDLEIKFHEH
jgi:DNA repair exonuclease SbcCD ATPase subunit